MTRGIRPREDRGGIVTGWLVKLAVLLSLFGVCLFDAIAIGTTYASTSDAGGTAARAASETWYDTHNVQRAYDSAVDAANDDGTIYTIDPKSFVIDSDGTVHLTISRVAPTILVKRIGPIRDWADVKREAEGRYAL